MDSTRNNPRRGRGRGRGRGQGGRGRADISHDYQHQTGGRGSPHQPPMPATQPPSQPAWGQMRPQQPQQQHQQPQMVQGSVGRGGAWTGRPWGPSASPPPAQMPAPRSPVPAPSQTMPALPSLDKLVSQKLQISDGMSQPSSGEGKESGLEPIRRPDEGGALCVRPIKLRANHFRMNFEGNPTILHYDVDVKFCSNDKKGAPRKMRKSDMSLIRDKLFSDCRQLQHFVTCYDGGKNIFSPVPLPDGQFTVNIPEGEDTRSGSYQVTIKFVNELVLSKLKDYIKGNLSYIPRDVLQGMDLVMKENLSRNRVCVGRSFFSFARGADLSERPCGLKAYRGLNQSVKATSQGPALCVDYSTLAFREPMPVLRFLTEHIQGFKINDINRRRQEVTDALKGLLVGVNHRRTKQKFTIAGLTRENTCDVYFDLIDPEGHNPPQNISLVQYFKDKWNREIEHKNIPCLELGRGNKSNKVPLEFCHLIEGQKYPKERLERFDKHIGVVLKKISLSKPIERQNTINAMVRAEDGPCGGGIAEKFGLHVDPNMTQVVGRVIGAPRLKLKGRNVVDVDKENGQWNFLRGRNFVDAIPIERWGLLEFVDDPRRYNEFPSNEFVTCLVNRGKSLGVRMEFPISHCVASMRDLSSEEKLEGHLKDVIKRSGEEKLQLIVCAMTRRDNGYKALKLVAETRIGVVTQVYLSPSAGNERGRDQYLANLLLKINAKLGGSNFEIDGKLLPCLNDREHVMFIGADVNHPAPMNITCPSIVAVVGTINWPAANRYAARVVPQVHRKEEILNFGSMCMDLVNTYKKFNRVLPSRIVLFQDGVSDAQFEMALEKELQDLMKVFKENGYSPKLTLIVAQKRHQTRLFVEDQRDGGRSGNVPPGTVVDTTIVHPFGFDFYLCSHYGILGTSKPTHYYVLWDDSEFSSDELQKLIYDMCFTFARCTKPVSLVPPVYYADLVAYRERMFQEAVMERQSWGSSSASSSSAGASFDESLYKMHPDMENNMFFI